MAWSGSAVFTQAIKNPIARAVDATAAPTGFTSLTATDVVKVALYDNTITPAKDVAVASTGYGTGVWVTTGANLNDSDGSDDWPKAGIALTSRTFTVVTNGVMYDAADTTHANTVTITAARGCFVYDDTITAGTVADQGISYHDFGGDQSVTTGTFTVVWHSNGLWRITV